MVAKVGYEVFRPGNRSGWAVDLLRSLTPGLPVEIPKERASAPGVRAALYSAATRLGFRVGIRTIDGKLHVARLVPEDEA